MILLRAIYNIHHNVPGQSHCGSVVAIVREVIGRASKKRKLRRRPRKVTQSSKCQVTQSRKWQRPQREWLDFSTDGQDAIGLYPDCAHCRKYIKQEQLTSAHKRQAQTMKDKYINNKTNTTP